MARRTQFAKKAKPQKISKAAMGIVDRQRMGTEPTWEGVPTENTMGKYYNWMTYFHDAGDGRKFLEEYLDTMGDKEGLAALRRVSDDFLKARTSVLWNARALNRGLAIEPETMKRFKIKLTKLIIDAISYTGEAANATPRVAVIEHVKNKAADMKGEIDVLIDQGKTAEIKDLKLTAAVAKFVVPMFQKELDEIDEATKGKDEELAEGYSGYTRSELKKLGLTYSEVVNAVNAIAEVKTVRKPQTRKIKTPDQLVKKLKYLVSTDNINVMGLENVKITSEKPTSIVGANELWVYNVTYAKLGVYRATDPSGLTVKGTTVLGWDEKSSTQKKLRKPAATLSEIKNGGKVAVRKTFESLKTMPYTLKGRLNEDTLLVRVFK